MPFCAYCGSPAAETSYRPCAACGNPTNGAPRPQTGAGGSSVAVIAIVLVLVAIPTLGIVAAIAIPNLLATMQRAKERQTVVEMNAIARDLEVQAGTTGSYPGELSERKQDAWKRELRYECLAEGDRPCGGYAISSAGKDGRFEHESAAQYPKGSTTKFDCDIVLVNGAFVQAPVGVQR